MQLQCGIGCAKNHKNNKTLTPWGFWKRGRLGFKQLQTSRIFFWQPTHLLSSHGTSINILDMSGDCLLNHPF